MANITSPGLKNKDSTLPPAPPLLPNTKPEKAMAPTYTIMSRRGVGSKGRPIPLLPNHFRVSVNAPDIVFYQYTVSISYEDNKPVEGKEIGRKLMDKLYQTYSTELANKKFAYDGDKCLYSIGPLPQNKLEFVVVLEGSYAKPETGNFGDRGSLNAIGKKSKRSFNSKTFNVVLSFATKIPMKSIFTALKGSEVDNGSSQDALRVLDIILRQQAASQGCLLVKQSFFHDDSRNFTDVGGGVAGVRGFHSSFRLTRDGLSLNMDVSTTMIVKPGPVIDFLLANQNVREPRYIDWMKAKRTLKNLRVKARHRNMEFKIIGLSEKPCNQQFFSMKLRNNGNPDGEMIDITVYDYFVRHCSIELTYSADFPCLDVGRPKRPNYLPLELCSLVSLQRYTKALSSMQRASLVEKSRQKPQEKIKTVTNALTNYRYDEDPVLAQCKLKIDKQLTQVEGRVLESPKLKVGRSDDCIPRNGQWNFNNKTLLHPTRIDSWIVINFSARCDLGYISRELINCGRNKGIHIEKPLALIEEDQHFRRASPVDRVENMLQQAARMTKLENPPPFILCVLPEKKTSNIYGPWKKRCLCDFGVVTQCISPTKVNDQYLTNLLLKINTKMGGINSLLAIEHASCVPLIKDTPTLILGMDVSHGSPGRSDVPSIAAVVGSRSWPLISRYRAAVRTQSPKLEMIDSLFKPLEDGKDDESCFWISLILAVAVNQVRSLSLGGTLVVKLFIDNHVCPHRDGVSESQFNQVLNIELDQIVKAYKHLGEVDVPKFTVIVGQKNHHTKFFQAGTPENVPPGMVVDTKVVHPKNYDFYMCAHAGMIGTSRPAHYHVLVDEIGFSPDDLQSFIHSLSYVYQRSTTALSIAAPICYAHLAAAQMSQFIKFDDLSETSSERGAITSVGRLLIPELPRLNDKVNGSMFFC